MEGMDLAEILKSVKEAGNFSELYQVTTFKGYRENKHGHTREETVDILDAGPDRPGIRYHLIATDEVGRVATGNPAERLDVVLATVHWWDLDGDPPSGR